MKKMILILILLSQNIYFFELAPTHIDSLFNSSVFVGVVKVIEGKYVENFGYKYKAEVLICLKGDSTKFIEFGEYSGTEVGSEYLIFLSNESENFSDTYIEIVNESGKVMETIPNYSKDIILADVLFVKYAGFGEMRIDYSIEANSDAILISTSHVIIPETLKRYPFLLESSNIFDKYYFKKDDVINYLRKL